MNNYDYEVLAETFRRITGFQAPGKDIPMGACSATDIEVREQVWKLWLKYNSECVYAVINTIKSFDNN